jgi:hypothetical protein
MELLQDMLHYKLLLKEFIRELDMENAKFINTCENLFEDTSPEDLSKLLSEPAPEIWKSAAIQAKLKSRLRPACIRQFTEAAESLNIALEKLKGKFPKEDDVVRTQLYGMSVCELT